jgi:peptidoglycan/xylan/chitin deacetylase (PgdA/CDA1 family)
MHAVIRTGLETLYFSGAHIVMRPLVGGVGAILTLHHVRPPRLERFQPNRMLEVRPDFLDDVIGGLRRSGVDFVSLDEMHRRLLEGDFRRRFVCVTFDDGYRDNRTWAYPILKKYDVPFALYLPTSFPDRIGELWWLALERVIAKQDRIGLTVDGDDLWFNCGGPSDKQETYDHIYWWLRSLPTEDEVRNAVRDLASRYQVDMADICEELCMTWDEVAELAADPLVTIGAHTVNHVMLKKVSESVVRSELQMSRAVIEAALGVKPDHFAYPVGDRTTAGPREFQIAAEVGYKTAVTMRAGVLFSAHRDHLMALPRLSLNGDYQQMRFVRVLLSGAATAFWNGFRHVNAA